MPLLDPNSFSPRGGGGEGELRGDVRARDATERKPGVGWRAAGRQTGVCPARGPGWLCRQPLFYMEMKNLG